MNLASDGALELSASFPVALVRSKLPHALQHHAAGLAESSTARATASSGRSRISPRTDAAPAPPRWRGRYRARAAPRPAIRLAAPRARARTRGGIEIETIGLQRRHRAREPLPAPSASGRSGLRRRRRRSRLSRLDRDAVGGDVDIAAQAQRLLAAIGDLAAALQPAPAHRDRTNSTLSAPLKLPDGRRAPAPLSDTWVVPGARKSSRSTLQDSASPCRSAAKFCSGRPPSMICSAAEFDLRRDRRLRDRGNQRAQRRQQSRRLGSRCSSPWPAKLVGIELPRRQRRMQQRRGAEAEDRRAPASFSALSSAP